MREHTWLLPLPINERMGVPFSVRDQISTAFETFTRRQPDTINKRNNKPCETEKRHTNQMYTVVCVMHLQVVHCTRCLHASLPISNICCCSSLLNCRGRNCLTGLISELERDNEVDEGVAEESERLLTGVEKDAGGKEAEEVTAVGEDGGEEE